MSLEERLGDVEARIRQACRSAGRAPGEVRLVAVSKLQPDPSVRLAYAAGQRAFGENYVQELERKRAAMPPDVEWHLIGHVQTNKAKRAAALAAWVHTVDSLRLASALSRARATVPGAAPLPVLVEVNVAGEATKTGVVPEQAAGLAEAVAREAGLELRGLMCIPPPSPDPRRWFARLRELSDSLRSATGLLLPDLSMGMSDDFEDAIREGATLVRVGTAIFGERSARDLAKETLGG